jgi:Flp pilus assembly protein TadD
MPGRDYMGIDNRADHSLRNPSPALSEKLKIPNACNMAGCHPEKPVSWSVQSMAKWYGLTKKPHYGTVLAAGREARPEARPGLIAMAEDLLLPAMIRASALSLLASYPDRPTVEFMKKMLEDDESLMRHTALAVLNRFEFAERPSVFAPLLYDTVRAVRMQAAINLTEHQESLEGEQKEACESALQEYRKSMEYAADMPAGRYSLGFMYDNLGQDDLAEFHYRKAIELDGQFFPAKNNLALFYNRTGRNAEAAELYRDILKQYSDNYEVAYSLGLLMVEMGQPEEAAELLIRAARGLPTRARIHYNLGLLLQQMQRITESEAALRRAVELEPGNDDFLFALADHYFRLGRFLDAKRIAKGTYILDTTK